jgi:hypothetical protein
MNRMDAVVFIGPSLGVAQARELCPAEWRERIDFRPPARMGDVYRAALAKPQAILVIDGYFENVPSVWHKEVLFAISQGVHVMGASSMGALRAAELHSFGMQGVGRIFEAYASGAINDDDEVAVAHGQGDGRFALVCEAMVNLRFALQDAQRAGLVDEENASRLTSLAKARFYPQRSWPTLWQDAADAGMDMDALAALREHFEATRPNQKRDDAIAGVQALVQRLSSSAQPARPNFVFEHTLYWETVESYFRHAADSADTTRERLRNHVRLFDEARDRTLERALLLSMVEQEARRLRIGSRSVQSDAAALRRFRQSRGLHTSQALAQWMQQQGVDMGECLRLARAEQVLRAIAQRHVAGVDAWLEPVLRLEGRWHEAVQAVDAKWQSLRAQGLSQGSEDDVGGSQAVLAWYQQVHGRIASELEDHVAERGFASMRHFLDELFAEYLVKQGDAAAAERAAA